MVPGPHYSPNRDDVVAKVPDCEAIMIDLPKGIYYSLDGVGGGSGNFWRKGGAPRPSPWGLLESST